VHAEAAWGVGACWGRDSDLPFLELVHGFVKVTLCHKMGHFLSEPNFQRCPIAVRRKEVVMCQKKRESGVNAISTAGKKAKKRMK